MSSRILIVGAGMAGVTAARRLRVAGLEPVVFDKGRRPGGRMASRTIGEARFDHGAQHFSVRSAEFAQEIDALPPGIVNEWFRAKSITHPEQGTEARHAGSDGMRSIVETLAADLEIHTSVRITKLSFESGQVQLFANGESVGQGSSLILTPPLPQAIELLRHSGVPLPADLAKSLDGIEYHPCLAVMAELDTPSGLDRGHASFEDGPIAWIGDNYHKGISAVPAVTIHSKPEYAAAHFESDPIDWMSQLTDAAAGVLTGRIVRATPHRWRFSQPKTTLGVGAVTLGHRSGIILAGEVFSEARVEGAFHSGLEAARMVTESL